MSKFIIFQNILEILRAISNLNRVDVHFSDMNIF